jgi:hypothetical protein
MPSKSFKQIPPSHLFEPFFNILAFLAPLFFFIRFAIRVSQTESGASTSAWLIALFYAIFLGVVLMITANYFCDVAIDDTGVSVTFLWKVLHVDWQDIVTIKPVKFTGRSHSWVVITKSLTPFHRLLGLSYAFSWSPSFIISPSLRDGEDLVKIIEERANGKLQK